VPDIGDKEKKYMKKKIKYTNETLGNIEVVRDFLPSPDELVMKDNTVKVTLNLSKSSVEFFKDLASKSETKYQKVIRNLLDQYVSRYSKKTS
jgi:predicted DNA binding CopG/RHH family protein